MSKEKDIIEEQKQNTITVITKNKNRGSSPWTTPFLERPILTPGYGADEDYIMCLNKCRADYDRQNQPPPPRPGTNDCGPSPCIECTSETFPINNPPYRLVYEPFWNFPDAKDPLVKYCLEWWSGRWHHENNCRFNICNFGDDGVIE